MSTPVWDPIKNGIWKAPPDRGLAETEPIAPSPEPEPEPEPEQQAPVSVVSFAQPHSLSPSPEPEQQAPVSVVSFAQPHSLSPSPEPEPEQPKVPSSPRYSGPLHPDDIPYEHGPGETPEFDSHGYEVEYGGGVRTYHIDNRDYQEEDIRNYDD